MAKKQSPKTLDLRGMKIMVDAGSIYEYQTNPTAAGTKATGAGVDGNSQSFTVEHVDSTPSTVGGIDVTRGTQENKKPTGSK